MVKLKWFLFLLVLVFTTLLIITYTGFLNKHPAKKIGVLMISDSRYQTFLGLKKGMEDAGFTDNELDYSVKNAENHLDKLDKSIEELLDEEPDVIVTLGGIETLELKEKMESAQLKIPVVFAGMADPKELGVIEDYRSPGTLFTGVNNYHTKISGKRLELLHELIPDLNIVHILYDNTIAASIKSLEETKKAANILGIDIKVWDINGDEYKKNIRKTMNKNDAIMTLLGFRLESLTKEIVDLSNQFNLPVMGTTKYEVEQGFFAAFGTSAYEEGEQSAHFVSLIIQGNTPSEIPVELPDDMRLMVNKELANEMHISLDSDTLHIAEILESRLEGGIKK